VGIIYISWDSLTLAMIIVNHNISISLRPRAIRAEPILNEPSMGSARLEAAL
jgi:hypothetical protein